MMTGELPALMQCRACGLFKPYEDFSKDARRPSGIKYQCKACVAAHARKWRQANLPVRLEAEKRWREDNTERARGNQRRYREANRERRRESSRNWRLANPEKAREVARKSARKTRRPHNIEDMAVVRARMARLRKKERSAVFAHYGTSCACCGGMSSLQIDHIAGVGSVPRDAPRSGSALYRWIATHGFPDGFQTLCRPCNRSKSNGSRCTLIHQDRGAAASDSGTPDSVPTHQEEP